MKKKLFNPYKWKKKMQRNKFSSSHSISIDDRLSLRPSTTEYGRWRRNPYARSSSSATTKTRIELFILLILLGSIFALCFFHPFFQIRSFSFTGLNRVGESSVFTFVESKLHTKILWVFPQKNYFLFSTSQLESALKNEYRFADVRVEKKFPHILKVEVEEKPPAIVYDNQENYILIGKQGEKLETLGPVQQNEWQIFTQTVSSTNEAGEFVLKTEETGRIHHPNQEMSKLSGMHYPLVHDIRKHRPIENVILSETTVGAIEKWFDFLQNQAKIKPQIFELLEGGEEAFIRTDKNWGIYIKFDHTTDAFPIFLSLLPQISKNAVEYVDMRYLTRVYWK